jgi:hypothetical protein
LCDILCGSFKTDINEFNNNKKKEDRETERGKTKEELVALRARNYTAEMSIRFRFACQLLTVRLIDAANQSDMAVGHAI